MKRIRFLPLVLAFCLLLTTVACTNDQDGEDSGVADTEVQTDAAQDSSADPFVSDKDSWN